MDNVHSTPSSQPPHHSYIDRGLPPPSQAQFSPHGYIPPFNQTLPPPPAHNSNVSLENNSQPSTNPLSFDHQSRPAHNPPCHNLYFKDTPVPHPLPSDPQFHPPILPDNHLNQHPSRSRPNPAVSSFQGVPTLERPEPIRMQHFRSHEFDRQRPASSTSEDLPQLDYSIINDFESQAFERERQAILSRNLSTTVSTTVIPSVTVTASSRPQKTTSRKSKAPIHHEKDLATNPPAKRSKKTKAPNEENLPQSTPINQSDFINGFLPKSMIVAEEKLPPELPSVEQLMDYSDIELNELAKKYSKKRSASAADEVFLLELHDQMEKIITINCIVRRISRDMADSILGRASPYRGISGYQLFQGSDEARAIVKENGGIRAPGTNAKVGDAWKKLGVAGQEDYNSQAGESARKKQLQKANKSQRKAPSHASVALSSNADSETQDQSVTSHVSRAPKFRTLTKNLPTVQEWMADLHPVANNIAKTYQVQIAIICVLSFLGEGNIQMVEATPRLRSWFELEKALNPQNHPLARMQSAVTGWAADELAEMGRVSEPDEISKARIGLNRLINIATTNKFKKWPWTNQSKLLAAGYEIQLLPGASTTMDIITRASNLLLPAQAIDLNQSLLEGKIRVVKKVQTAAENTDPYQDVMLCE